MKVEKTETTITLEEVDGDLTIETGYSTVRVSRTVESTAVAVGNVELECGRDWWRVLKAGTPVGEGSC